MQSQAHLGVRQRPGDSQVLKQRYLHFQQVHDAFLQRLQLTAGGAELRATLRRQERSPPSLAPIPLLLS